MLQMMLAAAAALLVVLHAASTAVAATPARPAGCLVVVCLRPVVAPGWRALRATARPCAAWSHAGALPWLLRVLVWWVHVLTARAAAAAALRALPGHA